MKIMTYRLATNVGNRDKSGRKRSLSTRGVGHEGGRVIDSLGGESSIAFRVCVEEGLDLGIVVSSGIESLLDVRNGRVVTSTAKSTVSVVLVGDVLENGTMGEERSPGEDTAELVGLNEGALGNGNLLVDGRSGQFGDILSSAESGNGEEECGCDLHDCGRGRDDQTLLLRMIDLEQKAGEKIYLCG